VPNDGTSAASTQSATSATYPDTDDGARRLLERIGAVGDAGLLEALRPADADYRTLCRPEYADRMAQFYRKRFWASPVPPSPLAKPGQSELRLWKATTEDISAWTKSVSDNFPGGYQQVKDWFMPGLTIYVWHYTEPGAEHGMFYNGLVHLNGHWAFFPKPWYVNEPGN
jgi:hypothetical protein